MGRMNGFFCGLLGALLVLSWVQRVEIATLKLVIWQMTEGDEGEELQEMFNE